MVDLPQRIVVATLGDSITAGTPGWDPDPRVRAETDANDPQSQYQHWTSLNDPRLALRNHGVNGERTDEIAARVEAAVQDAAVLVVQGGINDIVQARPVEDAARDVRSMIQDGLARGLAVVVAELLPWSKGWPDAEPRIRRLNELIARIAAAAGVDVLPFHRTLEDPERPGRMRADWTSDGSHPSIEGYRRLGELAFALPALPGAPPASGGG